MLEPFLKVRVLTVGELFSSHSFQLPWFQRAYAWSELHAGRLISDLTEAMDGPRQRYWLGHVFLATPTGEQRSGIIDGHQRAVTITIICALLRDMTNSTSTRERLQALIGTAEGDGLRLAPQPGVSAFFEAWVQRPGSTLQDPRGDILDLSFGERNLLNNRDHLRRLIRQLAPQAERREALTRFLLDNCLVTMESVEDEEEAWALLATAEETGLEFHSSERAKVSLISAMPREQQEEASHLFEQALSAVGADGMTNLLSHIRILNVRRRSSKPVERELLERFKLNASGIAFMQEELVPRAEAMAQINRKSIGQGAAQEDCANTLTTLFWLDHQMWMPAALHWVATCGGGHAETAAFFARLERLSYILKIAGMDPTVQERRYIALLKDIDQRLPVSQMQQLDIEPELAAAALESLRSRTFYSKRFHALVMRRVSWALSPQRDPGPIDGKNVTVEHVLPRRPSKSSHWRVAFPTPQSIADHCNRLGNLSFLTLHDNHHAGTNDYIVKRLLLAQSASRFVLSERAAAHAEWTPDVIMARTEELIEALFSVWGMKV